MTDQLPGLQDPGHRADSTPDLATPDLTTPLDEYHPELASPGQQVVKHVPIARFENPKRKNTGRKQDRPERKHWQPARGLHPSVHHWARLQHLGGRCLRVRQEGED